MQICTHLHKHLQGFKFFGFQEILYNEMSQEVGLVVPLRLKGYTNGTSQSKLPRKALKKQRKFKYKKRWTMHTLVY